MMIETLPSARIRATRSRIIAPSLAPIAASGSSSRMMSASECTVRAMAIAWRWPPDSRATGTFSRGTLTPISSSASRVSLRILRRARNGNGLWTCSRCRNMFCCTSSWLTSARSWYTQSIPSERAWSTDLSSTSSPLTISRPSSGFWKPEMILISVDLPAPLSPSSPSTSPLRRCTLMSRSAVTGPKRLEMCSTRSTSSEARASSAVTIRSSAKAAPLSHASDVHVDDHRDEDRHAQDEVEVVGVDPLQGQAVAQDAEEDRAEERADGGALAAGEQRAADDGRRHGAEHRLRRARGVGRHGARTDRLQHADQAGEDAAHDEVADDRHPDVDAGLGSAVLVAADGDRVHAPARAVQENLHPDDDHQRPDQLGVGAAPEDPRERADLVDLLGQRDRLAVDDVRDVDRLRRPLGARHRDRLRVGDDQRQAAEAEQHAERRDERRHAEDLGEDPVDDADHRAAQQREDQAPDEPDAALVELVEHERREQVDRADRQVDLARDHEQHLTRREDRERGEVREQRDEVRVREEPVGLHREVPRRQERDDDDAALAQRQEPKRHLARAGTQTRLGALRLR